MPWTWTKPAVFLTAEDAGDRAVFHCYKDGCALGFHYQIESDLADSGYAAFDIRELYPHASSWQAEQKMILKALSAGEGGLERVLELTGEWYEGETGE